MILLAERLSLADVLQTWMRRQRLRPVDLVRLSGLSRPTVYEARDGGRVSAETVRLLARALATDPYDGEVNAALHAEALRELAEAANYPHLLSEAPPPPDLDSEIRAIIPNRTRAAAIAEFVRRYPNMTPDQRRMVDALVDGIVRLGDKDVSTGG